jgi:ACDE family multidrug resistance protein
MTRGPRWWSSTTLLVVAIAMLGPLDTPPLGPALPAIAEQFSLSPARAGLVITAYAAPGMVFAPIIGSLADRYGRRRVLVPCLFGYGLAGLAVGSVASFPAVLSLRAVQGVVGGSILTSLAYAVVGDLFEGSARTGAMGLTTAGASVTAALAPAMGGWLAAQAWNAPFALYGTSLLVGVAALFWLPEPVSAGGRSQTDGVRAYLVDAVEAVPTRPALGVYGACLLGYTLFFGGVLTGVTFLLDGRFGLGTAAIGALVTGATMVTAVVALLSGRFASVAPAETLLPLGIVLEGVGLVVAGVAGWLGADTSLALPLLGAGLVAFGSGFGLFQPALASLLAKLGPERVRGGVMSLRTSVLLAGQAISAPLFTLSALVLGYDGVLVVAGMLGGLAGALWLRRR